MPFIRTHGFHECIRNRQGLSLGIVSRFIISAHFFIARPPPALALETLSLLGMAEKLGCSGGGQITANAHNRHLTANRLPVACGAPHRKASRYGGHTHAFDRPRGAFALSCTVRREGL